MAMHAAQVFVGTNPGDDFLETVREAGAWDAGRVWHAGRGYILPHAPSSGVQLVRVPKKSEREKLNSFMKHGTATFQEREGILLCWWNPGGSHDSRL